MKITLLHTILLCFHLLASIGSYSQSNIQKWDHSNEDALARLSGALKIKTISSSSPADFDSASFIQLRIFLENNFPMVHTVLERFEVNRFGYIYKWAGVDKDLAPYVLMAHQDVVPAEDAATADWKYPPFSGTVAEDTIWGRGVVDNKGTMIAILEAAEHLLGQNKKPDRTIYFCFGHDEETSGHLGAESIVNWFEQREIRPALVLDEGLEIIHKNYIPLSTPVALIGIGEKGYATFEAVANIEGGHSAAPHNETAIDILIAALDRVHDHPMPAKLIPATNTFLQKIKHLLPGKMRFGINNLWLFKKKLLKEMGKNNGTNSLIRTTIVTTMINSGVKDNVIPSFAKATINCRILPGQTVNEVEQHLKVQINDDRITLVRTEDCWDPPPATDMHGFAYKKIDSLVSEMFPDAVSAPLFVVGTTDARYFRKISDGVINFLPVTDSKGMHGVNEARAINDYFKLSLFFEKLMMSK
ncbi:MAG: M20/M25/M40 family metallo-hydrolase [Chitinophagaceae bacterium]|nr:M20/M25/M40 family metallo-hydrolase [Chitinophagaceae bacterium]MCB9056013.1 M20/M25/M40 family metallo-hydrolase [Chitinophagales bacterium]